MKSARDISDRWIFKKPYGTVTKQSTSVCDFRRKSHDEKVSIRAHHLQRRFNRLSPHYSSLSVKHGDTRFEIALHSPISSISFPPNLKNKIKAQEKAAREHLYLRRNSLSSIQQIKFCLFDYNICKEEKAKQKLIDSFVFLWFEVRSWETFMSS